MLTESPDWPGWRRRAGIRSHCHRGGWRPGCRRGGVWRGLRHRSGRRGAAAGVDEALPAGRRRAVAAAATRRRRWRGADTDRFGGGGGVVGISGGGPVSAAARQRRPAPAAHCTYQPAHGGGTRCRSAAGPCRLDARRRRCRRGVAALGAHPPRAALPSQFRWRRGLRRRHRALAEQRRARARRWVRSGAGRGGVLRVGPIGPSDSRQRGAREPRASAAPRPDLDKAGRRQVAVAALPRSCRLAGRATSSQDSSMRGTTSIPPAAAPATARGGRAGLRCRIRGRNQLEPTPVHP